MSYSLQIYFVSFKKMFIHKKRVDLQAISVIIRPKKLLITSQEYITRLKRLSVSKVCASQPELAGLAGLAELADTGASGAYRAG